MQNKVPELWIREKKKCSLEKIFPCLMACVKRCTIKNCVKWPKNIYIYVCLNIYEPNGNGREHVLNGKNAGFGKKYSKNIFPRVMAYMGRRAIKNCKK